MADSSRPNDEHWPERDRAPLDDEALAQLDAWWRAANYLSVGQIYLQDNPLLRRPLSRDDIKPRLLGHFGTVPGLNILYAHLNRVIADRGIPTLYITGPGHGGPGMVANAYLDGTYSEVYSHIDQSAEGLRRLFRQFSYPGGIPSHVAPETPGSIHEGGELGYSLSHAYGAAFDNPGLLVACVIGDGEAETGPLATSWHSNKFVDPVTDGVVLPILHLNGYKIANPTVLARIPEEELLDLMWGYGYKPHIVSGGFDGEDPMLVHRRLAETLDTVFNEIAQIKRAARATMTATTDAAGQAATTAASESASAEFPPPQPAEGGKNPAPAEGGNADAGATGSGGRPLDAGARPSPDVPEIAAQYEADRARFPMIILRTPKGWTCPAEIDGLPVEDTWRAHQVPLPKARDSEEHIRILEDWMTSYRPEELFDDDGRVTRQISALAPEGDLRMSATPYANGGLLRRELDLPDYRDYAEDVPAPGATISEPTKVLGEWLADVIRDNPHNFRIFGPDETASNRLAPAVYEYTGKQWNAEIWPVDANLQRAGRVMEMLSEHQCEGWLEGYLLTGRHGVFNCYEAFIHIIDSMFNQHAKWLEASRKIPWRRPVSSLNYLLSSLVWRQDHNGFSHQDPGFIDVVMNKKPEVVRVYLPPDANALLCTYDHCLRSTDYVNVVVAEKQPQANWLAMDDAIAHCSRGIGIWEWAGTETPGREPDVVLGCAGNVPTLETLAAASILRTELPDLAVRVVNVVDLMRMQDAREHPHGLADAEYDAIFTTDKPVIFAYHGYPWLIHRLTYRRHGHDDLHVRGYKENGTTTTPFDMVMMNDLDRYSLVTDVIDRVPGLGARAAGLRQRMQDARLRARRYTREHGEDIPEVANWRWSTEGAGGLSQDSAQEEVFSP